MFEYIIFERAKIIGILLLIAFLILFGLKYKPKSITLTSLFIISYLSAVGNNLLCIYSYFNGDAGENKYPFLPLLLTIEFILLVIAALMYQEIRKKRKALSTSKPSENLPND